MDTPHPPSKLWRISRAIGFVLFCLATLVFLAFAIENGRGKRAWEEFRRAGEAQGEKFDLAAFIPQPVPADQNFAQTPFLAPLLDYEYLGGALAPLAYEDAGNTARYRDSNAVDRAKSVSIYGASGQGEKGPRMANWQRGELMDLKAWQAFYRENTNFPSPPQPQGAGADVLFALRKYEPVLAELRAASQRPYAFFPIHYRETYLALLNHLSVLKGLAQVVELRAVAELEAGQAEAALADTKLALYFAKALQPEPTLISHLVRIAIINIALQPVWEGLAQHRWTDAQLAELQKTLAGLHLLEDYGQAMRGERAFSNELMAQWRAGRFPGKEYFSESAPLSLMPRGWFYQNQLVINRLHQQVTLPAVEAAAHRVYPEKCQQSVVTALLGRRTPYTIMAWMLFPAISQSAQKFALTQTALDQAAVACALERYRLAEGKYPETLAALAPKFIAQLPNDVLNGQPLKYRLDAAGQPEIYSVGWNKTDDGGTVAMGKGTSRRIDSTQGDWVWRYPPNSKAPGQETRPTATR